MSYNPDPHHPLTVPQAVGMKALDDLKVSLDEFSVIVDAKDKQEVRTALAAAPTGSSGWAGSLTCVTHCALTCVCAQCSTRWCAPSL